MIYPWIIRIAQCFKKIWSIESVWKIAQPTIFRTCEIFIHYLRTKHSCKFSSKGLHLNYKIYDRSTNFGKSHELDGEEGRYRICMITHILWTMMLQFFSKYVISPSANLVQCNSDHDCASYSSMLSIIFEEIEKFDA